MQYLFVWCKFAQTSNYSYNNVRYIRDIKKECCWKCDLRDEKVPDDQTITLRSNRKLEFHDLGAFALDLVSGDVSREWTDVTRQYRRQYQFVAPDVLLIIRSLASGRWLALHAATTATTPAAPAATLTVASIASIPFTLALRCPDLHDMLFESLDTPRETRGLQTRTSSWI